MAIRDAVMSAYQQWLVEKEAREQADRDALADEAKTRLLTSVFWNDVQKQQVTNRNRLQTIEVDLAHQMAVIGDTDDNTLTLAARRLDGTWDVRLVTGTPGDWTAKPGTAHLPDLPALAEAL